MQVRNSKVRIVAYTPVYGEPSTAWVTLAYHVDACAFQRSPAIEWLDSRRFQNIGELGRVRARAVAMALDSPLSTHLLSWDHDNAAGAEKVGKCLEALIASGHDVVGVPYPRKHLYWDRVAQKANELVVKGQEITGARLEGAAYEYVYRLLPTSPTPKVDAHGCVEVDAVGGGFMLVTRRALERMIEHYKGVDGLTFRDEGRRIVGLHLQFVDETGELLHDDYAFCKRWKDIGGKVHMYIGPEGPIGHVGGFMFKGQGFKGGK